MTPIVEEQLESYARNTRQAYNGQWGRFMAWLALEGRPTSLPVAPEHIREYLRVKFDQGCSVATLGQACKAIDCYHYSADLPKPSHSPLIKKTLQNLRRKRRTTPRQAHPLTDQDLQAIIDSATLPRPYGRGRMETKERARRRGRVDIALIRTMRDAQLRRGEAEVLKWTDITRLAGGAGLLADSLLQDGPERRRGRAVPLSRHHEGPGPRQAVPGRPGVCLWAVRSSDIAAHQGGLPGCRTQGQLLRTFRPGRHDG